MCDCVCLSVVGGWFFALLLECNKNLVHSQRAVTGSGGGGGGLEKRGTTSVSAVT